MCQLRVAPDADGVLRWTLHKWLDEPTLDMGLANLAAKWYAHELGLPYAHDPNIGEKAERVGTTWGS